MTARNSRRAAHAAGLRYVQGIEPGIHRRRRGNGFHYVRDDGRAVRDRATLARIASLVIPPAWNEVWICAQANGHLQATGRDARRRKQFRYHPRWREVRDENKYDRILSFAKALPKVRRRVARDLSRSGLPRKKVVAAIVHLLEHTLIRVGNDEYARANDSFGLTTMQDSHVDCNGSQIRFSFRGKSGKRHTCDMRDRRVAKIVQTCQDLPGQELFQYLDSEGNICDIRSQDVNEYLREVTHEDFTAKDFRTWAGTALAADALKEFADFDSQPGAKRNITRAIEQVARRLGNTTSVCRKCYVHPAVLDAYMDRSLVETLKLRTERELCESLTDLFPEEAAVLTLLQRRMKNRLRKNGTTSGRKPTHQRPLTRHK